MPAPGLDRHLCLAADRAHPGDHAGREAETSSEPLRLEPLPAVGHRDQRLAAREGPRDRDGELTGMAVDVRQRLVDRADERLADLGIGDAPLHPEPRLQPEPTSVVLPAVDRRGRRALTAEGRPRPRSRGLALPRAPVRPGNGRRATRPRGPCHGSSPSQCSRARSRSTSRDLLLGQLPRATRPPRSTDRPARANTVDARRADQPGQCLESRLLPRLPRRRSRAPCSIATAVANTGMISNDPRHREDRGDRPCPRPARAAGAGTCAGLQSIAHGCAASAMQDTTTIALAAACAAPYPRRRRATARPRSSDTDQREDHRREARHDRRCGWASTSSDGDGQVQTRTTPVAIQ